MYSDMCPLSSRCLDKQGGTVINLVTTVILQKTNLAACGVGIGNVTVSGDDVSSLVLSLLDWRVDRVVRWGVFTDDKDCKQITVRRKAASKLSHSCCL